jgi:hypothetical protein
MANAEPGLIGSENLKRIWAGVIDPRMPVILFGHSIAALQRKISPGFSSEKVQGTREKVPNNPQFQGARRNGQETLFVHSGHG